MSTRNLIVCGIVLCLLFASGLRLYRSYDPYVNARNNKISLGLLGIAGLLLVYLSMSASHIKANMGVGETISNVSREYFGTVRHLGGAAIGAVQQNPELIGQIANASGKAAV